MLFHGNGHDIIAELKAYLLPFISLPSDILDKWQHFNQTDAFDAGRLLLQKCPLMAISGGAMFHRIHIGTFVS